MNNRIIRKAIFILIPITACICLYCIFHDELSTGITPVYTLLMSFVSVLSIAGLFYLLYSITNDTLKDARQEAELLALNQQQKLKEQQSQTLASRRQQTLSLQENVQRDLHTYETLMDNGIESCQNSHSSDPFVQITASQNANFLTIHMTNSKDPSYKFNHKTNKTDSWAHGFGLAIIEEIASKYDGSCQWIDGGDVFESVVMVEVG